MFETGYCSSMRCLLSKSMFESTCRTSMDRFFSHARAVFRIRVLHLNLASSPNSMMIFESEYHTTLFSNIFSQQSTLNLYLSRTTNQLSDNLSRDCPVVSEVEYPHSTRVQSNVVTNTTIHNIPRKSNNIHCIDSLGVDLALARAC